MARVPPAAKAAVTMDPTWPPSVVTTAPLSSRRRAPLSSTTIARPVAGASAVAREAAGRDAGVVALQGGEVLAGVRVPDVRHAAVARGQDAPAIGGVRGRQDDVARPDEIEDDVTVFRVEEAQLLLVARRDQR